MVAMLILDLTANKKVRNMKPVKLVQTQLNALRDAVVEKTTIGEFDNVDQATGYLLKRGYTFDEANSAWIKGNTFQFPVSIERTKVDIFNIKSFV